jgi:UDP:flavonoid glycosyltransferase YjiC (YdhE family)
MFVEAVTLAHFGRSIRLASILHAAGWSDVSIASDSRYNALLPDVDIPIHSLSSISSKAFLQALARGRPVYSTQELLAYVRNDLALIERVRPSLIIGDFRLSLSVSARVAGIPYVNVTNAYWSPYARPRFRMPSLRYSRLAPRTIRNALFAAIRPLALAVHSLPLNSVRRAYALPSLGNDVRNIYCDGDLTLYADIPSLIPLAGEPPTHRNIGPVTWSPTVKLPSWWGEFLEEQSAPIYVSLGSSGYAQLLPLIIEALLPLDRRIIVATAGQPFNISNLGRVWVVDYLPGDEIAKRACVVICNGGSPTTQQAFLNGVPVLGIANNLDQYLNMDYVERFGAGLLLGADDVSPSAINRAARRAIGDRSMRARAQSLSELAQSANPEVLFPAALETIID